MTRSLLSALFLKRYSRRRRALRRSIVGVVEVGMRELSARSAGSPRANTQRSEAEGWEPRTAVDGHAEQHPKKSVELTIL